MAIILLAIRQRGVPTFFDIKEQFFGSLRTGTFYQVPCFFVEINHGRVELLGQIADGNYVIAIGINQLAVLAKFAADDGCKQYRVSAFSLNFVHIGQHVLFKTGTGLGMPRRIRLLIVTAKHNEYIVAGFYLFDNWLPQSLVPETFGAAAATRHIVDDDLIVKKLRHHLHPAPLRIIRSARFDEVLQIVIRHGGIADGPYGYFIGL